MSQSAALHSPTPEPADSHPSTISINDKRYAVGLFWQVASASVPQQIAKEAALFAQKLPRPHPHLCIKAFGIKQYGLSASTTPFDAQTCSAASTLVENLPPAESFLGVWQTGNNFWLAAIRAGAIHPNGDQSFASEEEAKQGFLQMLHSDEWDRTIAPAAWGIDASEALPLARFFRKPGNAKMRPLKNNHHKKLAFAATLLLLGSSALFFATDNQQEAAIDHIPSMQEFTAALPKQVRPAIESWKHIPVSAKLHKACMKRVNEFYQTIPGWSVANIECNALEKKFSAKWHLQPESGATAELFDQHVKFYRAKGKMRYEQRVFAANGENATLTHTWHVGHKTNLAASQPQLSLEQAEVQLWSLKQSTGVNLKLARSHIDPRIVHPPKGYRVARGKGLKFHMSTNLDPTTIFEFLYAIPGSVIYKISHSSANKLWQVEGFIHQKEDAPQSRVF